MEQTHQHGGNIYRYGKVQDFSANINFRGMPERVREAALAAVDASVHYPEPDCGRVRRALAKREQVPAETILCGNGAAELLFALAQALRPRVAVLAQPCFFEYEQALAAVGCRLLHRMLRPERGFVLEESFAEQIPKEADLVVLGNPNNPTGKLIETPVLQRILERCEQIGCLLLVDESFFDFLIPQDCVRTIELAGPAARSSRLFVLKSFTKMYAMPGLRFGYGICGDTALLARMRAFLQPWNVSVPAQMAAEAAAKETAYARETAEQIAQLRLDMAERLAELGLPVLESCTNYLLFSGPEGLDVSCRKQGYLIRNCGNFRGLDGMGAGKLEADAGPLPDTAAVEQHYYRVCVRSSGENEALLRVLAEILCMNHDAEESADRDRR